MAYNLETLADLSRGHHDTIIDVRSPSEFAEDHVPGAISLPVLSDDERARVGTIYVQESPFKARKVGAALVAKNAAEHLQGPLANHDGGWRPLVYCWRGGQRSGSFASILSQIGWRAETLAGGYQSYRRLVARTLYDDDFPSPVILLDGNTGTAKTDILNRLPEFGVQIIDLEGLGNHRGSVLGGQGPQPSQKSFESALAKAISALDPSQPVVIEAESSRVGRLNLPPKLFAAMKSAKRIEVTAPVKARAAYLTDAYSDLAQDTSLLIDRLQRLVTMQGHARVEGWVTLARDGDLLDLASELIEHHYDPRYAKVRNRRGPVIAGLSSERLQPGDIDQLATQLSDLVKGSQRMAIG